MEEICETCQFKQTERPFFVQGICVSCARKRLEGKIGNWKSKEKYVATKISKDTLVFIFPNASQEEVRKFVQGYREGQSIVCSKIKILYNKRAWTVIEG